MNRLRSEPGRVLESAGWGSGRSIAAARFAVVLQRVLSKCHDIRNAGEYEGDLQIGERIVADLLTACSTVLTKLESLNDHASGASRLGLVASACACGREVAARRTVASAESLFPALELTITRS